MTAADSFSPLDREIGQSFSYCLQALALVGAFYTASKFISLLSDFYHLLRLYFIPRLFGRADLVKQYGQWAVVTGSTDGVGKAYAEELARHGVNIILASRNKKKLEAVAKHIAETYKVETDIIVADFSKGRGIYSAMKEALRGKEIGILVNNVGVFYDYPDYFNNVPEDLLWDVFNVNIAAATMMVHIVLPRMVERKKGAIVNVSSGSCCQPTPLMTVYSAYLDHFSRALHYEYASKGIFIQSLIPFYISTNMTKFSTKLSKKNWLVPSAEEYAHNAVSTLGLSRRTTGYWGHFFLVTWLI
uniref:Uncharacterized protein n=1 Tax=Sphenodon punctatus TaxID=8508 RepID=A0A8D0HJ14_SPHPU